LNAIKCDHEEIRSDFRNRCRERNWLTFDQSRANETDLSEVTADDGIADFSLMALNSRLSRYRTT
jgi:hypothetical protein